MAWHTLRSVLAAGWIAALVVTAAACAPRATDPTSMAPAPTSAVPTAAMSTHVPPTSFLPVEPTTSSMPAAQPNAVPAALPTVADHGEPEAVAAIVAAQLQLADAPAFRVRQNTQTINQTFPMTLTYAAPDRYSMVSPGMHAVQIGDKGYYVIGGQWLPDDSVAATLQAAFDPLRNPVVIAAAARTMADARVLGTSTVNGAPANHFAYVVRAISGSTPFTSTFEIWIGADNGRILVQQVDNEASGITSRSQQFFEYGDGVAVEGP